MTWEHFKKYLYDRNRIVSICNKGTGNEIVELWNGLLYCEYQDPMGRIGFIYRSGLPTKVYKKQFISKAQSIYDYDQYEDVFSHLILAPQKSYNPQLSLF